MQLLSLACHDHGVLQQNAARRTFQKLSHLGGGGGTNFLLERGNSPKKGGEVDLEMGGWHFFITLQFSCIYYVCREKVNFPLLHSDSSFF